MLRGFIRYMRMCLLLGRAPWTFTTPASSVAKSGALRPKARPGNPNLASFSTEHGAIIKGYRGNVNNSAELQAGLSSRREEVPGIRQHMHGCTCARFGDYANRPGDGMNDYIYYGAESIFNNGIISI